MQSSRQQWADGIRALHEESGGAGFIYLIRPQDVAPMMLAALAGDPEASALLRSATDTAARVARAANRRKPMLCLSCPRPLRKSPMVCGVVLPARDDPSNAMGFALCERCGVGASTNSPAVLNALKLLWPDLSTFAITNSAGGHA